MSVLMLDAALDLVAKGWPVFPLDGKRPYARTRGHHGASSDPVVVTGWWERVPTANIGSPVPSKLVVLDVDPRNGGDVGDLGSLPATLTCWSGRGDGGRHLYFRRPPIQMFTGTRLPAGIDLKVSGYMVMAPSLHPETGQPYRWENHAVADLPARLVDLIQHRPRPFPAVATPMTGDGRHLVERVAAQPEGNRNNYLFWAARVAAREGLLDHIAHDLITAAVAAGETERTARRTVESARKRETSA